MRILPENTDQESEEKFSIVIEDPSPAEISQEKGNVTITVLKKVILLYNPPFLLLTANFVFPEKMSELKKHTNILCIFRATLMVLCNSEV